TLPAAALAQVAWPAPAPPPPAPAPQRAPVAEPWMAQQQHAPVAEPWMAQPQAPAGQPWQSPAAQGNRPAALEPIDLPPAIEQGVDMIYIDEALVPKAVHDNGPLAE